MRFAACALVALAACGPAGPRSTLPEPPAGSLANIAPALAAGEQTTWQVFWKTVAIGRADLVIGAHDVRSTFTTGALASALASVRYQLVTRLDRGAVVGVDESSTVDGRGHELVIDVAGASFTHRDGSTERVPGGGRLHTLHSALGVVRAWSKTRAGAGFLWLLLDGKLYRLDVFRPTRDEALGIRALRIDGVVRALDGAHFELSLWLAANRDRTPLRFVLGEISAEVSESTASFDDR